MNGNLQALAWVVAQTGDRETRTEYAIDGLYVYRRETNLFEAVPYYYRATHRDVLADDSAAWESCRENGEPFHPTWRVRVAFEHVAIVSAQDAESAKVKAIARLGLPQTVLREIHAVASGMGESRPRRG